MSNLEKNIRDLDKAIEEYYRAQTLKENVGLRSGGRNGLHKIDRFIISLNGFGRQYGYRVELDADDFRVLVYAGGKVIRPGPWQDVICATIWKQIGRDLLAVRDANERARGALDGLLDL